MKLQILIPQWNETDEIIKPLLDSIQIQQNVDLKKDVGVIIVNDGSNIRLSKELLNSYTYHIDYYLHEHKGVSATRNACLDYSTAEYIMFCDADDMFYNACGLYIIFKEIQSDGFDTFVSKFIEETRIDDTDEPLYINHDIDSTFVHGKVYRRQYLINQDIRWNEALTLHEDGYFNTLCQRLTESVKYCSTPFYLWKWRDNSVCRSDKAWVMKTYDHFIRGNEALVDEFIKRNKVDLAQFYIAVLFVDAYFTTSNAEWNILDEAHRRNINQQLQRYYYKYNHLFSDVSSDFKDKLMGNITCRLEANKDILQEVTFEKWLDKLLSN